MPAIKHIVMWKFKDQAEGADKATNLIKAKSLLDACSAIVPGIRLFRVAVAPSIPIPSLENTYDLMLESEFDSVEALDAYQNHPTHLALKPFIGAAREERQCMYYEI